MYDEYPSKFISKADSTVVEAMKQIDANTKGILFITDAEDKLVGCVTDGDIRRFILKNGDIKAQIIKAMNPNPWFLNREDSYMANSVMQDKKITAIPIVDKSNKIINVVFLNSYESECDKNGTSLAGVPVVIMAGGKGTRLYPYTKILPKPLIPIGDTPIVERIINKYEQYGIDKFYMTVNYKKGIIKSYFNDVSHPYGITYIEEDKPLGTGGSIKLIEDKFDKPLFVTNCDVLIRCDYDKIYEHHINSGNAITVVAALKKVTIPYGVIHSGDNGEICDMEEKPELSYFVNTGMYILNPEVISLIPEDVVFHMTDLIQKVKSTDGKVGMFPISEDAFLDMGEFDEMRRMEEKLRNVSE